MMCVEGGLGAEGVLQYTSAIEKREQGSRIAVLTSPPWFPLKLECNRCEVDRVEGQTVTQEYSVVSVAGGSADPEI